MSSQRRKYVTTQQAAEHLGYTAQTIRSKISEGIISGYRLPGTNSRAIRVDLNEIDRLMTEIPAVIRPKKPPFGEKARIVDLTPEELAEGQEDEDGEA